MHDVMQKQECLSAELDDENTFDFELPDDEFEMLDSWHFAQETHAYEIATLAPGFLEHRSF